MLPFKPRRKSVTANVGGVLVGSAHPVVVQSMTNTDTADPASTAAQVAALAKAGSQLVRITVNNDAAAAAVPELAVRLADMGVAVPIIGDFHYNGHLLLRKYPKAAELLSKYRINPGNVGTKHRDDNFRTIVEVAVEYQKPVRIGVNWGSLDQDLLTQLMDANAKSADPVEAKEVYFEAMLESALRSAALAEETGLRHDQILISAKISQVQDLVTVYRRLAMRCDYPLHLGLTEAGIGTKGVVATTAALAILLSEGIGDTIRVSLTVPNSRKSEEIVAGRKILEDIAAGRVRSVVDYGLQSLNIISCPSCSRVENEAFVELAQDVKEMTAYAKDYAITIAVMGCRVNGPGETDDADLGLWCGPAKVNLKRGGEAIGAFTYDEILPKLRLELDRLIETKRLAGC